MTWISVKEELPTKGTIYLVHGIAELKDIDRMKVPFWRVCFFEIDSNTGKPVWEIEKDKEKNQFMYTVTHWMPLPEKPT